MKTIICIILSFVAFSFSIKANQTISIDSLEKRLVVLEKKIALDELEDDEEKMLLKAEQPILAEKNIKIFKNKSCCPPNFVKPLPLSNKILVLSPLFALGLFFIITILFLKRSGFSLTQALSSKRLNEQGQTEYLPSSSKLLAFLSIMFGLIFIAFFLSFYFFMAFKRMPMPSFIGLWPVIVIIGLGILPYIIQTIFKK
ncbi:MAG: hypothetical protein N2449_05395 [Bacteroidales bacterium]|nr:hypothetical protein [Bacteroidales bacterium]